MKAFFTEKDRNKILDNIRIAMGDRKLGEIVKFALKPEGLEITISKLGTSILQFAEKATDKGLEYTLVSEKIAFTHRALKDEVAQKIVNVIEIAGGKVKGKLS